MNALNEMIEQARKSRAHLETLVEVYMTSQAQERAKVHMDALAAPMALLERLESFQAGEMQDGRRSQRFVAGGVVRHDKCTHAYADDNGAKDLKSLVALVADHQCPEGPEGKYPEAVSEARRRFNLAYNDAVGMNIFDTKTREVAEAAISMVHAVVCDERVRVSESPGSTVDQCDAMDRLVALTDPERVLNGSAEEIKERRSHDR